MDADTLQLRLVCVSHVDVLEHARATCARQVPTYGMRYDKKGKYSWDLRSLFSILVGGKCILPRKQVDMLINFLPTGRVVMNLKKPYNQVRRILHKLFYTNFVSHELFMK